MSKKAPKLRRNKKADEIERAAEEITDSYYLLVILGEDFSDASGNQILSDIARHEAYKDRKLTLKDLMKPSLSEQDDETFFGFWGTAWNRFQDEALNPTMRFIKRWRLVLYDDEDERYKEDKDKGKKKKERNERLEMESKVPKYSRRFFLITTNYDNDPHEMAFEPREYYEKKGTMKEWQCSRKCLGKKTKVFRPDEDENLQFGDFRFEVSEQTMLAPAIKYVPKTESDKLTIEEIEPPTRQQHADFRIIGDSQDWNFKHPHGFYNFDTHSWGIKPTENALLNRPMTREISDSRGMHFRYFMPSLAPLVDSSTISSGLSRASTSVGNRQALQSRNPVVDPTVTPSYYRPGQKESFRSVHDQSGVLRHFNSESLYSEQVGSRASSRLLHEFSFIRPQTDNEVYEVEAQRIEKEFQEEQARIVKKYSAPVMEDEPEDEESVNKRLSDQKEALQRCELKRIQRLEELKHRERNQELYRIQAYHDTLHDAIFSEGVVDFQERGVMSINVVDPLLHHHRYLTEVVDTTELTRNKVISGSDFEFVVSLKIKNKATGNVPINYFIGPVKPHIRKKNDVDNTYMDSIILDIHNYSPDHSRNIIPFEGEVSLIVECLEGKKLFSVESGHAGRVCPPELRPWHMVGEYTSRNYKRNKQQEIFGVKRYKHMVDYELVDKDSRHKLVIRTVQYENTKSEIVNVFIDLPITSFKKKSELDPTQPENIFQAEKSVNISGRMPIPTTEVPISSHEPIPEGTADAEDVKRIQELNPKLPPQHDPKLKPVVNRFLCADCGSLARPRIKMGTVDKKWVKTSMAFYTKYSKAIVKDLSENGERSLCILELGAGKATQKIADKLIKQTKQYRSTLVRIHPNPPASKKKVDAEVAEKTVVVQQPVGSALKAINEWVEEQAATLDMYFK